MVTVDSDTDVNCNFGTEKVTEPDGTWVMTGDIISERAPPQEVIWYVYLILIHQT